MSIYDNSGLSTNNAYLKDCRVEYTGSTPRIWCDAQSYPPQCTNILEWRTKFMSFTWTVLMSGTNTLPSAKEQMLYQYSIMKIYFNKEERKGKRGGEEQLDQEIGTNPLHAMKEGRGLPRQTSYRASRQTPQRSSYSNQVGMKSAIPDYL